MPMCCRKWKFIGRGVGWLRDAFKKKKKCNKCYIGSDPPPLIYLILSQEHTQEFFLSKMTQNGLKWILNTTCKNVTFWCPDPPPPPPNVTKNTCIFFNKLDHFWGTLAKKIFLPPRKVKTLVKIFRIAKIGEKWLSMGVPPHFSPKFFFAKWLRMAWNGF